jgi:hypothetical protein
LNATLGRHVYAIASALVASLGLLLFDWSPTGVLLLFWLEAVVWALAPLLVALAMVVLGRRGFAVAAVLVFLVVVLGGFLAGQAFVISVLGLFEEGAITDLHGTTLSVPLYEPLVATFEDRSFLAGAAAVAAFGLADLWPRLTLAVNPAPGPDAATWSGGMFKRLLVTHVTLILGGAAIVLTQLPSAAALLLVALKLWLDLRRVSPTPATSPAPAG